MDTFASITVTAIRPQTRNPNRVSIFCGDEFVLGVHRDVAVSIGIQVGTILTAQLQELAKRADASYKARDSAVHLLAYRPRTTTELRRKLVEKGYPDDSVETVIRDLTEEGLIDDNAFATEFVEQRVRGGRHGRVRIRSELLKRGISASAANIAIRESSTHSDWKDAAAKEARKKWQKMPDSLELERKKKRLHDHLVRRGFDFSLIREVMEEVANGGA